MDKTNNKDLLNQLPTNLVEAKELSLASKKTLAALLYWCQFSKARETGIIAISNSMLCEIAGISKTSLMKSIVELDSFSLVERKPGKTRMSGEKGNASEYWINFELFEQPLKQKSFKERFANLMELHNKAKSMEKPISTAIQYNPIQTNTNQNSPTHDNSNQITTVHTKQDELVKIKEIGGLFIDAMDYEEELNKKLVYMRWDKEEEEKRIVEQSERLRIGEPLL